MKKIRIGVLVIMVLWGMENIFAQDVQNKDEFKTFQESVDAYLHQQYKIHRGPRNNQYYKNFPDGQKIIEENLKGDYVILQPTKHGIKFTIQDTTVAVRRRAGELNPFAIHICNNVILGMWALGIIPLAARTFDTQSISLQIPPLIPISIPINMPVVVMIPANIFPSKSFLNDIPWWVIPVAIGVGVLAYLAASSSKDEEECQKPKLDCPE